MASNIILFYIYKAQFPFVKINKSTQKLVSFDGKGLTKFMGQLQVLNIIFGNKIYDTFFVVYANGSAILGLQEIKKLEVARMVGGINKGGLSKEFEDVFAGI